jgi:hypothetical protein
MTNYIGTTRLSSIHSNYNISRTVSIDALTRPDVTAATCSDRGVWKDVQVTYRLVANTLIQWRLFF